MKSLAVFLHRPNFLQVRISYTLHSDFVFQRTQELVELPNTTNSFRPPNMESNRDRVSVEDMIRELRATISMLVRTERQILLRQEVERALREQAFNSRREQMGTATYHGNAGPTVVLRGGGTEREGRSRIVVCGHGGRLDRVSIIGSDETEYEIPAETLRRRDGSNAGYERNHGSR